MVAYLSENADKRIFEALRQEGFEIIPLAPFGALSFPVDTHADMLLLQAGEKIFKHGDYFVEGKFENIFEPMGSKYPNDVLLNIAIVGKHAFANTRYASKTVLAYLEENGFEIHHVTQGYAHCSTLIVSENAIISADEGICREAQKCGIDALLISAGYIDLAPYEYGFIGGACGSYGGRIYLCGSLKYHPDGEVIRNFCKSHQKEIVELLDAPISDIGGILIK